MASTAPDVALPTVTSSPNSNAQSLSTEQITTIEAPQMTASTFPTWDAFSTYFSAYQRQTFQVYTSKSSTSVATRNQRIRGSAAASSSGVNTPTCSPPSSAGADGGAIAALNKDQDPTASRITGASGRTLRLVPTEVGFYAKTLICTHGGKPRSRSQGIRPRQRFRSQECPAKLNLVAQKKLGQDGSKADNWQVVVTQHVVTHNHSLDAKTYMSYPQNRRVDDPEVLETVNTLRKAGVKQSKIRSYLTEKAPNKPMTKSDVHNLLTKLKDDANFTAKLNATAQWSTVSTTVPTAGGQDATTLNYTTALPTTTQAQLNAVAARSRELQAEQARLLRQARDSIASTSAGTSSLAESQVLSGKHTGTGNADTGQGVHNIGSPLRNLNDVGEISSGTFKLRVSRLEEQNLALFAQNTKLCEQNKQYLAELYEARKKASEADGRLMALQKSESILTAAVSELSHNVEFLTAENARWKQQTQQLAASTSTSADAENMAHIPSGSNSGGMPSMRPAGPQAVQPAYIGREEAPGDNDNHREPRGQMSKRLLVSSDANDSVSEMVPPTKRVSREVAAEVNANVGEEEQQHIGGYAFSS